MKRAQNDPTNTKEKNIIEAQVFIGLISYIEESTESGKFIFKLSELYGMYVSKLKELGIEEKNS